MHRTLTYLLYAAASLVMLVTVAAAGLRFAGLPTYSVHASTLAVERTPDRVAHGGRLVGLMCAGCHRDRATGTLSGHPVDDVPSVFGRFSSANITGDPFFGIGQWTDGELAHLFRTGIRRDGRLAVVMPTFPGLSDDDMLAIIAFLRSDDPLTRPTPVRSSPPDPTPFGTAFARFILRPHAMPDRPIVAPSPTNRVAYGRYLTLHRLDCYGCHSANFATNDGEHPERSAGFLGGGNALRGADGKPVYSANLTPDPETGIGRWTEADFVRALKRGLKPDNLPLRSPMELMPDLTDEEVSSIYAYLRTVPALHRPRRMAADPGARLASNTSQSSGGEAVFAKYCVGCHGTTGKMTFDITRASNDLRTQDQLKAWIRKPALFKPGARMPAWDGILTDQEIEAVAGYVRLLGGQ